MDLSSLKLDLGPKKREIDPIRIFGGLTQRGQVETLYGPQQEALNRWHQSLRDEPDVLFSMSTGGGKTLVGLLAAQSLVNETRGKVLYVCPTNQLVQQTAAQAQDCGITIATYGNQQWTNQDGYDSCACCCITNYHAVFRGGSRFAEENIRAVLFDDAHVAPATIRSCFTMFIGRDHAAWGPLMGLFRSHFEKSPFATRFDWFTRDDARREGGVLFVPGWFVWQHREEIAQVLATHGVDASDSPTTRFAYRHLRDHLTECAFFIGQDQIEITPPVIPTHALPYFRPEVRRIYLTATLPSRYDCIRTFGVDRAEVVSPSGKIGAAQRLFVFPQGDGDGNAYDQTRSLIADHKACIIVPSKYAATKWEDVGEVYDSRQGHAAITEFAAATDSRKMILAGLFDGIDLPGKACKVLVLDGIPRGACLHDRFLEDHLDSKKFRLSQTAGRLTQAIGRIFRSNTDHGVVILADKSMQSWLREPERMAYLPELLQQQVVLGDAIRHSLEDGTKERAYPDLMRKVIDGARDWDEFYNTRLAEIATEKRPKEPAWGDGTARKEYDAWRDLWEGRHRIAATALNSLGNELADHDRGLAAWQLHWCGVAHLHDGDEAAAEIAFQQAANAKAVLGRPLSARSVSGSVSARIVITAQARRAVIAAEGRLDSKAQAVIDRLQGDGGTNAEEHEQAICDLGLLLGLVAQRPEKTDRSKRGPDVTWLSPEMEQVVGLEAKTQKTEPLVYRKRDIGQALDSREWLRTEHAGLAHQIWIVGQHGPVVAQASPPDDLRIVLPESLIEAAERLLFAARRIAARPTGWSVEQATQEALAFYGLLWPGVGEGLEYRLARDLQDNGITDADE